MSFKEGDVAATSVGSCRGEVGLNSEDSTGKWEMQSRAGQGQSGGG